MILNGVFNISHTQIQTVLLKKLHCVILPVFSVIYRFLYFTFITIQSKSRRFEKKFSGTLVLLSQRLIPEGEHLN